MTEALELWRGRAFEDVEDWELALIEAGRLDELRLEAEELRVDASLRVGRHMTLWHGRGWSGWPRCWCGAGPLG